MKKKKRKRKENRISLLRGNPLARFPPNWNRVAVYTRANTLLPRRLVGYNSIKLWNILKVLGAQWWRRNASPPVSAEHSHPLLTLSPFQNKLSHTYGETLFKTASELCCREGRIESEQIGLERGEGAGKRKIKDEGREKEGGTELSWMVCEFWNVCVCA